MSAPPAVGLQRAPERILVVRLGALGDVVRTLPAMRLLRRTWPKAAMAWAVEEGASPLLLSHPDLDKVFVLPRRELERDVRRSPLHSWSVLTSYVRRLRDFSAELAIDFQSSFKSGLLSWLSGARERVGFDAPQARELSHWFATTRAQLPRGREHRVERAAALAEAAGALPAPLVADLGLTPGELRAGHTLATQLRQSRPAVALAPWSSQRQAWKRYPLENWLIVARGLAERGATVIILGGPGEEDETAALCAAAGRSVVPSTPLAVRDLASLLAHVDLFVGGDTGPMHLAWAVGTPVVAVYGPTDPLLNAPFGAGHTILAPPRPTARSDSDRFPGITPERILLAAARHLEAAAMGNTR